ncbi:uncharacterized protein TNCT_739331 [Trichonephila clavata]|uniref:Uncharacterized protein n=1 Tax=Trichonephila clavata TaxID=2740835 RepID=A0A8X6HPF6_TRICU|nr:uncharacterized protein TNCT_739331 [Trichonephila clavata]
MPPTVIWLYRDLIENYRHDSPFIKSNEKTDETNKKHDTVERKRLDHFNKPSSMVLRRKRVYYFTPKYFSNDKSNLIKQMQHFYNNNLKENTNTNFNADSEYYLISKRMEKPVSQAKELNIEQSIFYPNMECEYVSKNFVSENFDCKANTKSDYFGIHFLSHALDVFRHYLILPFIIPDVISGSFNTDQIQNPNDSNMKDSSELQKVDAYSLDDESFEDFCLKEEETKLQRTPRTFLLSEQESEILEHNEKHRVKEFDEQYLTPLDKNLAENNSFPRFSEKFLIEPVLTKYKRELKKDWNAESRQKKFQESVASENSNLSFSKLIRMLLKIHEEPSDRKVI